MLFESGTGGYYKKTNAQPTLLQKSMPGMMDGWMDDSASFIFSGKSL
jgi:hypothetical protein